MVESLNSNPVSTQTAALDTTENFLVVGIGASAGGIQALRDFFSHVPAHTRMAYVVILHLSPDHDSKLAEVLQSASVLPVTRVERRVRVEPDHVYVIPPNKSLEIKDGHIEVKDVTSIEVRHAPVDIFFRTLAQSHGPCAVSVVLSGTGANGSMGMKRVKEMGGLCIVQDPREAEYDDMPRHSLATGLVDYILPVAEIPAQIIAYREQLNRVRMPEPPEDTGKEDLDALRDVLTQLRIRTGHDFSNYKPATIMRRIGRRLGVHQLPDLDAYSHFMHDNPAEATALLKDLLISVTNFFRDAEAFEALERHIVPKLFEGKGPDDQVRVWVPGCATGEEAYSVTMLLSEFAATLPIAPQIQVFATDIDEDAIATAREGFYSINDAADVSPERLARHFVNEGDGYRVRRELRERVLFAVHNIIKDPPFAHLDLATCRNFLIYLNRNAQRRVMNVLHFALNAGGYLMLGNSEAVDGASDLFSVVDKEHRIYEGRAVETRLIFPVPDGGLATRLGKLPKVRHTRESQPVLRSSYAQLHQRLLERYAPPSIVVNEDYDIVHISESAGKFMRIQGGELSTNILALICPELRLELRAALYQAAHHKTDVESHTITVPVDDQTKSIRVQVRPVLSQQDKAQGFFLVLFKEDEKEPAATEPTKVAVIDHDEPLARHLEAELLDVKRQLRAALEQHELQREELKASNEELQAMNEEMRSAAEELETSKEELQSINEELTTVNQELKIKIEELAHTNNDLRNLMNSTPIGTVFLTRELRIKLFTPYVREIFSVIPADVGRGLSDITSKLDDRVIEDARKVLETLQPIERTVRTKEDRAFLMQVFPYRTNEDRIDGVVLTFIDITERERAEHAMRESEEQLRRAIEDAPIPVIMHAEDGEVLKISRTWTDLTGYTISDVPTFEAWLTRAYGEGADDVRNYMHELFKAQRRTLNVEFTVRTRDRNVRYWSFSASSPGTLRDGRRFIVGMAVDITERKRVEKSFHYSDTRLRLMMESMEDYAIMILDADGHIEMWNSGAEHTFGYSAEEIIGQDIAIIFTPEDRRREIPMKEMATARERGRAARERGRATNERWHLHKDGTRFYVSGVLSPLFDSDGVVTGYVKIARDLTQQRRTEEELRRANDELENRVRERTFELAKVNESLRDEISERIQTERDRVRLLRQIVRAQEDERRRIARDIHDQVGQQMTALRLNLAALDQGCAEDGEIREKLEQTKAIAERLDADVDFLAWELRPAALDDIGVAEAMDSFVRQWSRYAGVEAQFHTTGLDKERLSPESETSLYRIMQEALNNTLKYAQASRVDVLLERRNNQVVLIVEDDGVGFNPKEKMDGEDHKGMGLIGMRERAALVGGTLQIESRPKEGTTIFVRVPAQFGEEEAEEAK